MYYLVIITALLCLSAVPQALGQNSFETLDLDSQETLEDYVEELTDQTLQLEAQPDPVLSPELYTRFIQNRRVAFEADKKRKLQTMRRGGHQGPRVEPEEPNDKEAEEISDSGKRLLQEPQATSTTQQSSSATGDYATLYQHVSDWKGGFARNDQNIMTVAYDRSSIEEEYRIAPELTDISALAGKWFVQFYKGTSYSLTSYRDCITFQIDVEDGLTIDNYKKIKITDRRKIDRHGHDYVQVAETYKCRQDLHIINQTMILVDRLSVLQCVHISDVDQKFHIMGRFEETEDQFLFFFNARAQTEWEKVFSQVALRKAHTSYVDNNHNLVSTESLNDIISAIQRHIETMAEATANYAPLIPPAVRQFNFFNSRWRVFHNRKFCDS